MSRNPEFFKKIEEYKNPKENEIIESQSLLLGRKEVTVVKWGEKDDIINTLDSFLQNSVEWVVNLGFLSTHFKINYSTRLIIR